MSSADWIIQQTVICVVEFLLFVSLTILCLEFLRSQTIVKKSNGKVWKNKFVALTLFTNLSFSMKLLNTVIFLFLELRLNEDIWYFDDVASFAFVLATTGHLCLVYSRSKIVFSESNPVYLKVLRFSLAVYSLLAVTCATIGVMSSHTQDDAFASVLDFWQAVVGLSAATLLGILDVVSTVQFANYVMGVQSKIRAQNEIIALGDSARSKQTSMMAKRSGGICLIGAIAVVWIWMYFGYIAITGDQEGMFPRWALCFQECFTAVCFSMWIFLKWKLDEISRSSLMGGGSGHNSVKLSGSIANLNLPNLQKTETSDHQLHLTQV
eukprot:TRINITY_DN7436_c0_g2_i1.p1 TRINITY_DN7436_c0_g2~~TRINITY_DN7436_c0_g2_i1.p1  ORF type:complete len:323 (-),score=58.80 TRINITY_DN7436_c0_g2_i1:30-998(-)